MGSYVDDGTWQTQDGRRLAYHDMENTHLANTLRYLLRKALTRHLELIVTHLQSPMPREDVEGWLDTLRDLHGRGHTYYMHEKYQYLYNEADRRNLQWRPDDCTMSDLLQATRMPALIAKFEALAPAASYTKSGPFLSNSTRLADAAQSIYDALHATPWFISVGIAADHLCLYVQPGTDPSLYEGVAQTLDGVGVTVQEMSFQSAAA